MSGARSDCRSDGAGTRPSSTPPGATPRRATLRSSGKATRWGATSPIAISRSCTTSRRCRRTALWCAAFRPRSSAPRRAGRGRWRSSRSERRPGQYSNPRRRPAAHLLRLAGRRSSRFPNRRLPRSKNCCPRNNRELSAAGCNALAHHSGSPGLAEAVKHRRSIQHIF